MRKISWTNTAAAVCAILQIVNGLSIFLLLIVAFHVLIDPASIDAASGQPVTVYFLGMNISLNDMALYATAGAATVPGVVIYMLIGCARSVMYFMAFGNVRQVIDCSRTQSPFLWQNVQKLRQAGGLFLGTVGLQLAYAFITMILAFGSMSFSANIRVDTVILGVTVLCVSEIFAQGARLQDDQDGLV